MAKIASLLPADSLSKNTPAYAVPHLEERNFRPSRHFPPHFLRHEPVEQFRNTLQPQQQQQR